MNYAMHNAGGTDLTRIAQASNAKLPASYEAAKQALANCEQIDECKDWADKAAALASYARQAEDVELERKAARIRARAMRRAGELLKAIEPAHGANQNIRDGSGPNVETRKDVGERAGMSDRQIKTAIRIANIPKREFEKAVESPNPPTITTLAEQGVQKRAPLDPATWLKGRTPEAFNKALHFTALVEEYAKDLGKSDLETILVNLDQDQISRIRASLESVEAIHRDISQRI